MIKAALEVGGTFINIALGDEQYNISHKVTIDTKDPDETIQQIVEHLQKHKFESIQIASFGPLCLDKENPQYGSITSTPKLKWQNYPLGPRLSELLHKPFTIDTDVNACAMAEYKLGNHGVK